MERFIASPQSRSSEETCAELGRSFITGHCSHGNALRIPMPCNDYANCDICLNSYIGKIRSRINDGLDARPYADYQFLTFTQCRHTRLRSSDTHCPQCLRPRAELVYPNPHNVLLAWREFRRWYNRNHPRPLRFFRILEPHQDGNAHLHAVIDATQSPLPLISKARNGESLDSYITRQSEDARLLIERLCSFGFGPIADIQDAYENGHGASKYLTWYLGKEHQARYSLNNFVHESGRRVRLYDCSNDWKPKLVAERFTYAAEYVSPDADADEEEEPDTAADGCDICTQENADPALWRLQHHLRRRVDRWIVPVADTWPAILDTYKACNIEYRREFNRYTTARLRLDNLAYLLQPNELRMSLARHDANRAERVMNVHKERRKALIAGFRRIGYNGPVALLNYATGG